MQKTHLKIVKFMQLEIIIFWNKSLKTCMIEEEMRRYSSMVCCEGKPDLKSSQFDST